MPGMWGVQMFQRSEGDGSRPHQGQTTVFSPSITKLHETGPPSRIKYWSFYNNRTIQDLILRTCIIGLWNSEPEVWPLDSLPHGLLDSLSHGLLDYLSHGLLLLPKQRRLLQGRTSVLRYR